MNERQLRMLEWSVLAVALIVRLAALRTFQGTDWAEHPMVDAYTYWAQAGALLDGKNPFGEGFYQPPAYPVILYGLGKISGGASLLAVRIFQQGLGLLTAWLLLRLGRVLGQKVRPPQGGPGGDTGAAWVGAAAALIYSLYPTTLFFELDVLTPAVTSACLAGALLLIQPGGWRTGLAGLLTGIAVAVHPTYLLAAAVMGGWLVRSRRHAVIFAVALALPILPTTLINLRDFGTPALVSHNSGINFYLGNNPGWRTTSFLRPGLPFRKLALEAEPHRRDAAERNTYWRSRAFAEIAAHPDAWAATLLTKAFWSVHDTEIPRNEDYRCRTGPGQPLRWMGLLPVRWGWVFPLALAGLVPAWRRGERFGRLLGPLWLALMVPMVLFLVADRYRLAAWPVVALLAPLGVVAIRDALKKPHPAWIIVLVGAVIPWLPIDPRTQLDPTTCAYASGNLLYMEQEWAQAQAAYETVIEADPDDMGANYWLGYLALKRKNGDAAIEHFTIVADRFDNHFPTLKELGRQYEKKGDLANAARYYRAAYEVPGNRTPTGALLVRVLVKSGRRDEAVALVQADPKLAQHKRVKEALSQ